MIGSVFFGEIILLTDCSRLNNSDFENVIVVIVPFDFEGYLTKCCRGF